MSAPAKSAERYGNFDLVTKTKLDFTEVLISKWKSRVTGLSVVHLDYDGMQHPSVLGLQFNNQHTKILTQKCSPDCRWIFRCRHRK